MNTFYQFALIISCFAYVHLQKFEEESPFMKIRWLDMSLPQWKPTTLDQFEKVLDKELKYADERKGIECKSIKFEQEAGYPKSDGRFLDTSIRGYCIDHEGRSHDIPKEILTVAIERRIDEVSELTSARVYSVGNVVFYKRNRNILNLIIIPISVGFTLLLTILTFVLRRVRYSQKRRHILSELEKKKSAPKKGPTVANQDPNASEKQRLLQLDPTVVGSASDTLGSPKEFTNDPYPSPTRSKPSTTASGYNRDQDAPPSIPSKDNRAPYYNRDDDGSNLNQRGGRSSRERTQVPYENTSQFSSPQYPYNNQQHDMIPMQEQQPRVVVRTVRNDGSPTSPYSPQYSDPSTRFVPIPVQIERPGPQQRFVSAPYHSDPYYRNTNA